MKKRERERVHCAENDGVQSLKDQTKSMFHIRGNYRGQCSSKFSSQLLYILLRDVMNVMLMSNRSRRVKFHYRINISFVCHK